MTRIGMTAVALLTCACATSLSTRRVAVLIDERREAEPSTQPPSAEAAHHFTSTLVGALVKAGWEVVQLQPLGAADPAGGAAAKAAREKGAAWVVTGNVLFRSMSGEGPLMPAGTLFPVLGHYDVRVFDVARGTPLGVSTGRFKPSMKRLPLISYDRSAIELVELARERLVAPLCDALAATR